MTGERLNFADESEFFNWTYGLTCGCGIPSSVRKMVWEVLETMKTDKAGRTADEHIERLCKAMGANITDSDPAFWFVLNGLDEAGLLEHGTSARFSWLTPDGETVLKAFEQWGCEDKS